MATLKEVQNKIGAVKKTRQITKAMNMVATSRLRGAQQNMEAFRPYAAKFAEVLGSVSETAGEDVHALLVPREEVKKINIVLCTSDKGLCGGFNVNLQEAAEKLVEEKSSGGASVSFTSFGKKGRDWARKNNFEIHQEYIGIVGSKFGFNVAMNAGRTLVDGFLSGKYDEVHVVYSEFISMGRQVTAAKQLLPIPAIATSEETQPADENEPYLAEHICEPSADEILGDLLPRNVYVQLFSALLETSTSEHAARMTAMDNATKACNDMLDELTNLYNKARQATITAELMDIVGGAEALRG